MATTPDAPASPRAPSARRLPYAWLAVFALWTFATWFFEGRIHTLLRPDAVVDRLAYVTVANLVIGVLGAAFLARRARAALPEPPSPSPLRVAISLVAAVALGIALLLVAGGAPPAPWVVVNGYAQVLSVTVAEVAVCWWALHLTVLARFPERARLSLVVTVLVGAVAFGPYHFAHSPPFDTWPMVLGLGVMGLVTGVFFAFSRDLYATVVFHNFAGTLGVLNALRDSDRLALYEAPMLPVLITGAVALAALVLADRLVARPPAPTDGALRYHEARDGE